MCGGLTPHAHARQQARAEGKHGATDAGCIAGPKAVCGPGESAAVVGQCIVKVELVDEYDT